MIDPKNDVLFCGMGQTPICYYRVLLPAMALGADWVGVGGDPPDLVRATGLVKKKSIMPDFSSYKVVVLQQPASKAWREFIKKLRDVGVVVIFEVDDYVHGIAHLDQHDYKAAFDKKHLWEMEQTMKVCDALIASTEWIKGNYSHFNRRTYLCRNGIDLRRYELTKPRRESVNIGWAGATGHLKAVVPWFQQVAAIMRMRENVNFISIGQNFAAAFQQYFPDERAIAIPWSQVEQYPAAMTMFDIALAPAAGGGWWRGKSDLRWLEAGALGIPIVADPRVYPEVEDGVTGFTAVNPMEAAEKILALADGEKLRTSIGQNARRHVREKRSIDVMAKQWLDVFNDLVD